MGSKFIDKLAADIKLDFPEITGFSVRNLKYMRKFVRIRLKNIRPKPHRLFDLHLITRKQQKKVAENILSVRFSA